MSASVLSRFTLILIMTWGLTMVLPSLYRVVWPIASFGLTVDNDGVVVDVVGPFDGDAGRSPAAVTGLVVGDRLDLREMNCWNPQSPACAALVAVLGDQVQAGFFSIPSTLPHVKTGKLRMLGIGSARRSQLLPDVPTIAEAGVPGYDAVVWYGVVAPARTPHAIVEKLNRELVASMQSAEMRERLAGQGAEPRTSTPEEFAAYLKSEIVKHARIVKEAGLQAE